MLLTSDRCKINGLWVCHSSDGVRCQFMIGRDSGAVQHGAGSDVRQRTRDEAIMSLVCWAAHFWDDDAIVYRDGVQVELER